MRDASTAAGALALALAVAAGCGEPSLTSDDAAADAEVDATAPSALTLSLADVPSDGSALVLDESASVGDGPLVVDVVDVPEGALVSVEVASSVGIDAELEGWEATERLAGAVWWRARPADGGDLALRVTGADGAAVQVRVIVRRAPPDARQDRSLVWTTPAIVDDPTAVGLARVMSAAADDHGGALLDTWLRIFARTAHSERPALADFADHLSTLHGDDPAAWDLGALPFRVTAVHNRIDLRNDAHCGELRVSLNVTDDAFPFIHFLFLFAQEPTERDVSFTGAIHCEETAATWARLSDGDAPSFEAGARAILDRALVAESFLLAESLERSVGTWEWRQWKPNASGFENPPLFQTVDVEGLSVPGPERDALLSWITAEAPAIVARRAPVPARFSPLSARATEGVPRPTLDLGGLDSTVDRDAVAGALDTMGCPGCHARSPTFLQTNADRTFSPFYEDELAARALALDSFRTGAPVDAPFGALSD